ncbi:MAG TPA: ABC transporter permease [Gemmatimonadales bacterium]|nr:ABC transporter permease [Gemmatimonadales bacterium]
MMLAGMAGLLLVLGAGQAGRLPGEAGPVAPAPAAVPVALERRLAERLRAGVGDTVLLSLEPGAPVRPAVVTAVYEPPSDPAGVARREYGLRFHLPHLADFLGAEDRVDRLAVALRAGVAADSAAARFNQVAFGFRAFPSAEIADQASQTFVVVSRFHDAIAVISVVASAVFLLCIMLLKVEERRHDAALMRFIGVRRRTIFGALLLEAVLVAAVGSGVGVGLALLASATINAYYRRFFDTALLFSLVTPGVLAFSVALSLGLGVVAGAVAAWRLVRTRPLVLWGRG